MRTNVGMAKTLAALGMTLVMLAAHAGVAIPPVARVTDQTGTLDAAQRGNLEQKLAALEQQKGSQIAVLIVPTTAPETIEQYAVRVADAWKLGRKGVDDGVLLLVAKDDHALRIEVGYGLEGPVPDAIAKRIVEETITPKFRQGDFAGGIYAGVEQLIKVVEAEPLPPSSGRARQRGGDRNNSSESVVETKHNVYQHFTNEEALSRAVESGAFDIRDFDPGYASQQTYYLLREVYGVTLFGAKRTGDSVSRECAGENGENAEGLEELASSLQYVHKQKFIELLHPKSEERSIYKAPVSDTTFYETFVMRCPGRVQFQADKLIEMYGKAVTVRLTVVKREMANRAAKKKEEKEAQLRASEGRQAKIKSGELAIQNFADAKTYYNAQNGNGLLLRPQFEPDHAPYAIDGVLLNRNRDGTYIGAGANGLSFFLEIPPSAKTVGLENLRVGTGVKVIGKYLANLPNPRDRSGLQPLVPKFEAVFVDGTNN